jgi:hypothetical protein
VAGYQEAINDRVTTIDPGGCAPARSDHSVVPIFQKSILVAPEIGGLHGNIERMNSEADEATGRGA